MVHVYWVSVFSGNGLRVPGVGTWNSLVIVHCIMQGQPTNFTMELTGPAVEQLASQSGDSNQFKQAIAALLPGISESPISAKAC